MEEAMNFHIFQDDNKWYWLLVASSNFILASSIQGYPSKADCLESINMVKRAYDASVLHIPYLNRARDERLAPSDVAKLADGVRLALGVG